MIVVDVHENAVNDLRLLRSADEAAAAAVLATLEQLKADPGVIDKLTTSGTNTIGSVRLGIKRWESMRHKSNLWRFRIFDTPATSYRIIYGYHWQTRQLCIFAIVHKEDFDYDDLDSDIARRIMRDWESL